MGKGVNGEDVFDIKASTSQMYQKISSSFFPRCLLKAYYFNFYFNFICDSGIKGAERKGGGGGKRLELKGEEGGSLRPQGICAAQV